MPRRFAALILALGLGLAVALPSTHALAASSHSSISKCVTLAPEAPIALGLPLSALAVFGVYVLRQRRHGAADDSLDGLAV